MKKEHMAMILGAVFVAVLLFTGMDNNADLTQADFEMPANEVEADQPTDSTDSDTQFADSSDDPKIIVTIVNDKDCKLCDTTPVTRLTDQAFKTIEQNEVDISSTKGKELIETYEIKSIPFYIFSAEITQAANYDKISQALVAKEDSYYINPAAGVSVKSLVEPSLENAHVKGDANAQVTIVEWSDFECPFCGKFYSESYSQIVENYVNTGKVRMVFKHFPLNFHPNAVPAAVATECAGEQGKFWEMHDKMFESQKSLSESNFKTWAQELGLDSTVFSQCLASGKFDAKIQADLAEGQSFGISGTPGFVVNGVLVSGAQPYTVFEQIIEAELQ